MRHSKEKLRLCAAAFCFFALVTTAAAENILIVEKVEEIDDDSNLTEFSISSVDLDSGSKTSLATFESTGLRQGTITSDATSGRIFIQGRDSENRDGLFVFNRDTSEVIFLETGPDVQAVTSDINEGGVDGLISYRDEENAITRQNGNEIHIGENSLVTKEENGEQLLFAEDSSGASKNIRISNGSRLLVPDPVGPEDAANKRYVDRQVSSVLGEAQDYADGVGAMALSLAGMNVSNQGQNGFGLGFGSLGDAFAISAGTVGSIGPAGRYSLSLSYSDAINKVGVSAGVFWDW